jgi:hypothetical protein
VDKLRHCAPAGEVEKNDTGKLFFWSITMRDHYVHMYKETVPKWSTNTSQGTLLELWRCSPSRERGHSWHPPRHLQQFQTFGWPQVPMIQGRPKLRWSLAIPRHSRALLVKAGSYMLCSPHHSHPSKHFPPHTLGVQTMVPPRVLTDFFSF